MGNQQTTIGSLAQIHMTKKHYYIIDLFKKISKGKTTLVWEDLLDVFPQRSFFCRYFFYWISRLSYKKQANREGFIFAMELFLVRSERLLNDSFKNHSFNSIDFLIFISCFEKPYKIVSLQKKEVLDFVECFLNVFFVDGTYDRELEVVRRQFVKELDFESTLSVYDFQKYLQHIFPSLVYFLKAQLRSLCYDHKSISLP